MENRVNEPSAHLLPELNRVPPDSQHIHLMGICGAGMASLAGMRFLLKAYAPLILKEPLHRRMLLFWIVMYAFVGIQMGWLLRPFVGNPTAPVEFLRPDAWGNAYVVIVDLILNVARRIMSM